MMNIRRIGVLVTSAVLAVTSACGNLDVTNPNAPDVKRALATPEDVRSLANSSLNRWYLTSTAVEPALMFGVTADVLTANFGNFGMRFNNLEPRIPYNNTTTGSDFATAESPWYGEYAALGAANDAIRAIKGGVILATTDATNRALGAASLTQALTLTDLALEFDQAFILDETTDPAVKQQLSPYKQVTAAAMGKWDALITFLTGKSLDWGEEGDILPGVTLTATTLRQIANTMAARLMVYSSRTKAENDALNWAKVLTYARAGITTDFAVTGDYNTWWADFLTYADYGPWISTDMRIIAKLDPTQPTKFNGTIPPKATSLDARLASDWTYRGGVVGQAARGVYMQSPWYHTRYAYYSWASDNPQVGPAPYALAAENDLLIAEALVRTGGSKTEAAALINKTRVGRGKLAPLAGSETTAQFLDAILYERDIELMNTGPGLPLYDHRRFDDVQAGTLRHLPVPAKELEVLQLPLYTFGGVGPNDKVLDVNLPDGSVMQIKLPGPIAHPRKATGQ